MPLPELQKKLVEKNLGRFCENRVSPQFRNQIRIGFKIHGNSVTIFEQRPSLNEKSGWVDIPVAQLRYIEDDSAWALYYPDRNCRWHKYLNCEPSKSIDPLLREITEDPTGIFWG